MAEVTPGLGDITPKSSESPTRLPKPESAVKKSRTPLSGPVAKIAGAALAAGVAFGVSVPDQGGIKPITVSAAGETPTPTPTPDPLQAAIEVQRANNARMAGTATAEAKAKQTEQARSDTLNRLQNEFNRTQDQRATVIAQGPVLSPPERATATRAAQLNEQATRIAAADVTSTVVAQRATQTAVSAAATATTQSGIERATATAFTRESAATKAAAEQKKRVSPWGLTFTALGTATLAALTRWRNKLPKWAAWPGKGIAATIRGINKVTRT